MKLLSELYLRTRKFQLNSGSHPEPPWRRPAFSECSTIRQFIP